MAHVTTQEDWLFHSCSKEIFPELVQPELVRRSIQDAKHQVTLWRNFPGSLD